MSAPVNAHRHRGVVTVEYAFILILGLLPLLLITFTGMMIFTARQSLEMAAQEGARAAMRFASLGDREATACEVARSRMQWLIDFAGDSSATSCEATALQGAECGLPDTLCMRVTTAYDYNARPFLPGTRTLYRWTLEHPISSTATAQLDLVN